MTDLIPFFVVFAVILLSGSLSCMIVGIIVLVAMLTVIVWQYIKITPVPPSIFKRLLKPKITTIIGANHTVFTVYEYRGRMIKFHDHIVYFYESKYPNLATQYTARWCMVTGNLEQFTYFSAENGAIIVDYAADAYWCDVSTETFITHIKEVKTDIQNAIQPPECIGALRILPLPISEEIKIYYRSF